jgi:hypothetical protein
MTSENKPTQEPVELPQPRKPYAPPRLVSHGTIQDLTQTLVSGNSDANPEMGLGSSV